MRCFCATAARGCHLPEARRNGQPFGKGLAKLFSANEALVVRGQLLFDVTSFVFEVGFGWLEMDDLAASFTYCCVDDELGHLFC